MSWDATTNMTQMDGSICLLLMFLLRAFYCIQMNPLCKLYLMEELSSRKLTDVLNKNLVQYRGEAGLSQHPS